MSEQKQDQGTDGRADADASQPKTGSTPSGGRGSSRRMFVRGVGATAFAVALVDLCGRAMAAPPNCGNGTRDSTCGGAAQGGTKGRDQNCGQQSNQGDDSSCSTSGGGGTTNPDQACGNYRGTVHPDSTCGVSGKADSVPL